MVDGRITDRYTRRGRSDFAYYVKFSYTYGALEYFGEQMINKIAFDSCKLGMAVKVRCLPDHPETARLIFPTGHLHVGWEHLDWE